MRSQDTGLMVMSDLTIETRPCPERTRYRQLYSKPQPLRKGKLLSSQRIAFGQQNSPMRRSGHGTLSQRETFRIAFPLIQT